ncbi:MAG TPA: FTR1 family protein [Polyangia bacterium]|jgi:high-affinity iron transporter|nr:FTR1 family protein [Polyangia bacterium]
MLQSLLVTFREGLESFLIVGVISAYLRKTGRAALLRGVHVGLGLSVVTCVLGAWLWQLVPNQPLYEGVGAFVAAGFVGALLWQAVRVGRRIKGAIEARVDRMAGVEGASPTRARSLAGVALVTAILVTREGLEAVFYLGVQAFAIKMADVVVGAAAGLVLAAVIAWTWTRFAHRLNLGVVLKVTAIFLGVFLVQLVIYGIHELAESGVIEGSRAFHDATEIVGPDGRIGHLLSYSLLGAPLLYLFWARRAEAASRPPAPA